MTEAEVERRALAIFERLATRPGNSRFRERLLRRETPRVAERVAALERSSRGAALSLPTEMEGLAGPVRDAPERIGPFRLVERLGTGGMGDVWRGVRDDGLYEQQVAVKLLHGHLSQLAGSRFAEERRILARLEHPNIARLIDGGVTDGGVAYLVLEYVEGRPLDDAAAARPLRERIALFLKAAEAVSFAHSRLVVHADLKPSNILVTASDWVKLLDFGIARLLGAPDSGDGEVALHPLTRAYASPSRLAGAPPTIADDVFALGTVLREIVAGAGDPDLAAIATKATADEPERYGSVDALAGDLERWRERLPVTARPATFRYRASRFVARHRLGVAATAAALLLLSGTTVAASWSYIEAERARAEASERFDDVRGTARYLLFDLYDRLERLPYSLPLRAEVAQVSRHYLDRLAASRDAPAEVRLEAAEGLIRLAERQGTPARPNLGQPEAARASLNRALASLAGIEAPAARTLRARSLIARAELENQVFSDLAAAEKSLAAARPLVAGGAEPGLAAEYLLVLGALRRQQSRYPEAIALALRTERSPGSADPYQLLTTRAYAVELLADSYWYANDATELPIRHYSRAVAMWEDIRRRFPNDIAARRGLIRARYGLAYPLISGGRKPEAERLLARAAADAAALSAREPRDEEAKRMARVVAGAHAQALAVTGQVDEAVAILERQIAERRREWAAARGETRRLRDLAINIAMVAELEADAGREASACRRYEEVMSLFERLRRSERHVALDEDHAVRIAKEKQAKHCPK